jgi:hypothetical protein
MAFKMGFEAMKRVKRSGETGDARSGLDRLEPQYMNWPWRRAGGEITEL